jgi:hypothetical protein
MRKIKTAPNGAVLRVFAQLPKVPVKALTTSGSKAEPDWSETSRMAALAGFDQLLAQGLMLS